MARLIFLNQKLQGILKITEQSKVFRATFDEAVEAYEKETGFKYYVGEIPDKYYEHNKPTMWLVKDEGIYLMSSVKMDPVPKDKSHVAMQRVSPRQVRIVG